MTTHLKLEGIDGVIPVSQSRSRAAQSRLLAAGEQVFSAKGYDQAHVTDIAAAAGCSVGSFYRRFRDKEALFRALHAQFVERSRANLDRFLAMPQWAEKSDSEVVETLFANTARIIRRHSGFFRALFQLSTSGSVEEFIPAMRASDEYGGRQLAAFLRDRGNVQASDLEERCVFALRTLENAMVHRAVYQVGPVDSLTPAVVGRMSEMFIRYVGIT